jgi:hypothetical protein
MGSWTQRGIHWFEWLIVRGWPEKAQRKSELTGWLRDGLEIQNSVSEKDAFAKS